MSGPWERYQQQEPAGPWERYAAPESLAPEAWIGPTDAELEARRAEVMAARPGGLTDVMDSFGSGVARGVAGLLDIPRSIGNATEDAAQYLAGRVMGYGHDGARGLARDMDNGSVPLSGLPSAAGAAETVLGDDQFNHQPVTTAGEFAGTAGEFLPGALAFGGGNVAANAIRFGLIPSVASEGAGQAAQALAPGRPGIEAGVRAAAAIGAGVAAAPRTSTITAGTPEQRALGQTLVDRGIAPTAGQVTRSPALMHAEGRVEAVGRQLQDFTRAAMRSLGSDAARAGPTSLRAAGEDIVRVMDDILGDLDVPVTMQAAQMADEVATQYIGRVPAGQLTPRMRGIADEIIEAATGPNAAGVFTARQLREWRTDLGALTASSDDATSQAAHGLRVIIDDLTDEAMRGVGREADIAALEAARVQYRNFLGVRDAATRAGAQAGELSPQQLYQSVLRTQGRGNVAIQRGTTELEELARAGSYTLAPLPAVGAGGVRSLGSSAMAGMSGSVIGSQMMPSNPLVGGLAGAAMGWGAPNVASAAIRSNPLQNIMLNPGGAAADVLPVLPGLMVSQ